MRFLSLALPALLLAPAVATAAPRPVPAATPNGKAERCVPLSQIRESRVRSDQVIDFYLRDGRILRNTLPNSCPQLGFEQRFAYGTSLNQLCSVDIITVLQVPGAVRGASCGLGEFQPVAITDPKQRR
ncbi:MAG: hypothetical protein PGN09_07365 [Sphingomonas fennica]